VRTGKTSLGFEAWRCWLIRMVQVRRNSRSRIQMPWS
jgi:hypothetical protein